MSKYCDNNVDSLDPISENKKTSLYCTYIIYKMLYMLYICCL